MYYCLGKVQKTTSNTDFQACVPLTRGKVFNACIRSALLHGIEIWAPTAPDLQRLPRNDRGMIRWICSVKLHDEVPMETLYTKLGIGEVAVALRTKRLRWYGHVAHASSWTNSITSIAIPGPRGCGRPRKSWSEYVKADVEVCNLEGIDLQNREAWRSDVRRTYPPPPPRNWETICSLNKTFKPGLSKLSKSTSRQMSRVKHAGMQT